MIRRGGIQFFCLLNGHIPFQSFHYKYYLLNVHIPSFHHTSRKEIEANNRNSTPYHTQTDRRPKEWQVKEQDLLVEFSKNSFLTEIGESETKPPNAHYEKIKLSNAHHASTRRDMHEKQNRTSTKVIHQCSVHDGHAGLTASISTDFPFVSDFAPSFFASISTAVPFDSDFAPSFFAQP